MQITGGSFNVADVINVVNVADVINVANEYTGFAPCANYAALSGL